MISCGSTKKLHRRNSDEVVSKYMSGKMRPYGAKSPLVKFYNLKRDVQEDNII